MTKLIESIDKIAEQAYLGAIAFWVAVCAAVGNIFIYQFRKLAQIFVKSLGDAFWYKIKLETDTLIDSKLVRLEDKINNLDSKIDTYKNEKHTIEGELLQVKEAIIKNDKEVLELLKRTYSEREGNNVDD